MKRPRTVVFCLCLVIMGIPAFLTAAEDSAPDPCAIASSSISRNGVGHLLVGSTACS